MMDHESVPGTLDMTLVHNNIPWFHNCTNKSKLRAYLTPTVLLFRYA